MFNLANQTHFNLGLDGLHHDLQVLAFNGHEGISRPYRLELELIGERASLDLEALLHRPAFLAFTPQGQGVHGLVYGAVQADAGERLTRYRLTLVPQLAYLAQRSNQRIFQYLTVPQIVALIPEEHGILADAYRFQLGTRHPERECCVQYDGSDLHFVQHLCAEKGIHFCFQHSAEAYLLMFGDDQTVFPRLGRPTTYVHDSELVANEPVTKRLSLCLASRTTRTTRRDYDFEKPWLPLEVGNRPAADAPTEPDLEDYDYPGRFIDRQYGKLLSQRVLERHRVDRRSDKGASDQSLLVSGHFLEIAEHLRAEWNDPWLLSEVFHEGEQPQVLEENVTSDTSASTNDFQQGYCNRFLAMPWEVFFRLPLKYPKPHVLGNQTAVVAGPSGEEIHCDRYGRVRVWFHWDREGQGDDKSSCWLRVVSGRAGSGYGGIVISRVGVEVLVDFLEGDPDQPLVSGCVYHVTHPVSYELSANQTRSVFKSLNGSGGGGHNEPRIEDRKGQEQTFVHAQRDWDENIEHDQKIRVGHERHDTVEVDSYSESKTEEHRTVHGERKVELKTDDHLTVGDSQHVKLGRAYLTKAGREIRLKVGQKMAIEVDSGLTVKAGGSLIRLDASDIAISGPLARINAGDAPGSGSGTAIRTPRVSGMADQNSSGVPSETVATNLPPRQPACGECLLQAKKRGQVLAECRGTVIAPNPRHWASELWRRSHDRGLQTYVDMLADATGLDDHPLLAEHTWRSGPPALFKLLEQTPEIVLADEGPSLLRLEDGHAAWLGELLERIDCRRHLMLLFSPWPLSRLGECLCSCTQVEWNQGCSSGVLRFYGPDLFMAVGDMLDPWQGRYPYAPVSSWHWLDRDGRPRGLAGHYQTHETPSLQAVLRLEGHQVAILRAWSEAEVYRREYFVLPCEHGLDSQESLLQHPAQAHLAADCQGLQDFDQRDAFVAQWLCEQTPGPGFSPTGASHA